MASVRDFHGHYFQHLLREAMAGDGITVGQQVDEACSIEEGHG
jgi:hypothetical protein